MAKNLRWKVLVILGVLLVSSGLGIYPIVAARYGIESPAWLIKYALKLGLDLQGGLHLVLRVNTDDALKLETETTAEQVRVALADAKVPGVSVKVVDLTQFGVESVPEANDQQFRKIADDLVGLTYDRSAQAAGSYLFKLKVNVAVDRRREAVSQALQTIEKRVNALGVSEPVVAPYGSKGDQIIVQLPGIGNLESAERIIQSTAQLKLQLVESGPMSDQASLLTPHGGKVPDDLEIVPGPGGADASPQLYLLRKSAAITGSDLRNALPTVDEYNLPAVRFLLKRDGVAKFTRVTEANIGRQLAIVLDGKVQSAPVIEGRIDKDEARITGRFTTQEAADLALVLKSGALPASLTYLERQVIGPSLGADSIRAGILASIVGVVFVALFMVSYYRLAGINAIVSVAMNLIILLGFMAYVEAVMTLPGIAGFILTIGIGVDSNVLIFERIREELALKKGARQAVAAGFDRVILTIIDTHVASLIAAAFLFQFGTGPIRGFATTLFFGLLSNVFTAVFVSRTLFEAVLAKKPAASTQLSI